MIRRRPALLNLQPGEARIFWFLFVEYFFLGVTSVFTQASAFALFLTEFGSQGLPASYVSVAIGASLVAFLYLKIGDRFSLSASLIINLGSLAVISLLLRVGLAQSESRWVVFLLPIWFQIVANLTNLALWTLAGRLLDVRQGKRLFGLIGTGNWIAIAAGGFVVSPIVAALGTPNLLLLAGISLGVALGFQFVLLREHQARLAAPVHTRPTVQTVQRAPHIWQNRYVLLILALVIVSWVGFFFIDNIFYDAAASQISDLNQLASFIGALIAATGVIGLITTTFVTGPVIGRYGVGVSLLVLPVLLMVSSGVLALSGTLVGVGLIIFALASFNKVMDVALGFTLDLSARTILYQPLPAQERVRIHTIADGIVQPISIGVAGLLLLVFNTLLSFHAVQLSYLYLLIGAAWIMVTLGLRREYPLALAQALAKRHFGENSTLPTDRASVALLKEMLHDPRPRAALYAANVLHELEPSALAGALTDLVAHPAPEVRSDALQRLEKLHQTQALTRLVQRLTIESSPELKGLVIRTIANLGGVREQEQAMVYLDDPSPRVRLGAIVGLINAPNASGHHAAESTLSEMVVSADAQERALAAQAIGELGDGHRDLLEKLLSDPEVGVQRAALWSIARTHDPHLYSLAVEHLSLPQLRRAAMVALAAGGEDALTLVSVEFQKDKADPAVLVALAKVCGKISGEKAVEVLKLQLEYPDPQVRSEVLAALSRCHFQANGPDAARVHRQMRNEVERACFLLAARFDLGEDKATIPLYSALDLEIAQSRARLFYLLSFLYDGHTILDARDNLRESAPEKRAYALEILDIACSPELKPILFPVLEGLEPAQCLTQLAHYLPQQHLSREARLEQIISAPDAVSSAWSKMCARYAAYCLGQTKLASAPDGGSSVISIIEKVIVLKGVDLFAETPDAVLADIAAVVDEVQLGAGETVFSKGDKGDSLYVIVSGQVQVHEGAHVLNELGEGDVFGEMALLDPEPRLASVTAIQETRLLRLDQTSFQELLEERGEIARNVIRVLTRRLRARVQDLETARSAPEPVPPR